MGPKLSEAISEKTPPKFTVRLWTGGFETDAYRLRDLWRIVLHPTVIALSLILGCSYGYFYWGIIRVEAPVFYLMVLSTGVCVILVNAGTCMLIGLIGRIRVRLRRNLVAPVVPTIAASLVACPAVLAMNGVVADNFLPPLLSTRSWGMLPQTIVIYLLVSELVIFLLFRYMVPAGFAALHPKTAISEAVKGIPSGQITERPAVEKEPPRDAIQIGSRRLAPQSVVLLEAQGNYLRVVTEDCEYMERFQISKAIKSLGPKLGLSPHRSFWVAYDWIKGTTFVDGRLVVEMHGGAVVRAAGPKSKEVQRVLQEKGFL